MQTVGRNQDCDQETRLSQRIDGSRQRRVLQENRTNSIPMQQTMHDFRVGALPSLDRQERQEPTLNNSFVDIVNVKRRNHEKVRSIVNYDSMYLLQKQSDEFQIPNKNRNQTGMKGQALQLISGATTPTTNSGNTFLIPGGVNSKALPPFNQQMQLQENNFLSTYNNSFPTSPQMQSVRQSTASPLDIQSAQFATQAGTPTLTSKKKVLSPRERILLGNSLQVTTVQSDKILQ